MVEKTISIGLGELEASKDPEIILAAHGLGSCIGIVAYDAMAKVGGMSHVLLPDSTIGKDVDKPGKFADTAIPLLIKKMQDLGATTINTTIKIAGGAQMFAIPGLASKMNIGEKNIIAVKEALKKMNLKIKKEDTGGSVGRTVKLYLNDGHATIRTTGLDESEF